MSHTQLNNLFWFFEAFSPEIDQKILFMTKRSLSQKGFAPPNELHTAKLSFSGVMKSFFQKLTKKFSLRSKNWLTQNEAKKSSEMFFFSMSSKVGNQEELFWIDQNDLFWLNLWNGANINKISFAPQNEPIG